MSFAVDCFSHCQGEGHPERRDIRHRRAGSFLTLVSSVSFVPTPRRGTPGRIEHVDVDVKMLSAHGTSTEVAGGGGVRKPRKSRGRGLRTTNGW